MSDEGAGRERVQFTWDGERVEGRAGEPIAAALWRAGHTTQTRGIKYHRPRGPQCFTGGCPGCLVRVDGVPNVRGCRASVRPGLDVESQVGRPDAGRDLLAVVDRLFERFDHERAFVRPRLVSDAYEAIARHFTGFGEAPEAEPPSRPGERIEVDVLVAGGGPAGLGAASAAAEAGASVLLASDDALGGSLLHVATPVEDPAGGPISGPELATRLASELRSDDRVHLVHGTVFGLYEDGAGVTARTGDGWAAHVVDARATVLAVGAHEGPVLVDGNDVPGVLGARAARILLNRWHVPPGTRVVVADPQQEGHRFLTEAKARGLNVEIAAGLVRIEGGKRVRVVETRTGRIQADAVVVDPGLVPSPELAQQAGLSFTHEPILGGRVPVHRVDGRTPVPGVLVAGSCAGLHDPVGALAQGRAAGALAAGGQAARDGARDAADAVRGALGGLDATHVEALARVWEAAP